MKKPKRYIATIMVELSITLADDSEPSLKMARKVAQREKNDLYIHNLSFFAETRLIGKKLISVEERLPKVRKPKNQTP